MELKHLHTFFVLSEIKNFTKTAQYLHYAQSNVTAQIKRLEEELGVLLFERIGKNITLTPDGEDLLNYAQQMIRLSGKIQHRFDRKNEYGRITIGASESICICFLPEMVKLYRAAHPDVELYLKVLDTADFSPLLADNTIDLAFALGIPEPNPALVTAASTEETVCLCSVPESPLAQKTVVTIRDFSDTPLILTGKDCCYRKAFEKDLSEAGIQPKIILETGSLQVIKQTALSGLGICLLPKMAVQKELDTNELVQLPYRTDYGISSQLLYHKDKWISKYLKDFIGIAERSPKFLPS